ncbi:MAG: hypothetical protein KKH77_06285 [Candidatus Omnitrophica bacterium]|nr:hypothetical protein [Candidatus Omnitrophota bacterium]MBU0881527.1 hypothetical protein [Candidatus Omnitrophota bacterium]
MRKISVFAMIFLLAVTLTGCDALQRKFTRKKKETKPIPRLYQLKKYDVKPSAALYSKHYAYWQSWMSELIQDLGDNHKKDVRCIDEALSQLHDMRNILVQEKADALTKHIRRIEKAREIIIKEGLSQYNKNQVLMTLEREDRIVKSEFTVSRIKNDIKESFDETP